MNEGEKLEALAAHAEKRLQRAAERVQRASEELDAALIASREADAALSAWQSVNHLF